MNEIVGFAEHYAQFIKLCRLRIEQLGITYETVDAIAGFPARYTATLLCQRKAMSVYSLFTMARALALLPIFEHDEAQFAQLSRREDWIEFKRKGARYRPMRAKKHVLNVQFKLYPDLLRKARVNGGYARAAKMTERQRIRSARHAARIRWHHEQ